MTTAPQFKYQPHVPSLIPYHVTLYDKVSFHGLTQAMACYSDTFPTLVGKGEVSIFDVRLLEAAARAEAFLFNFSTVFGIVGSTGDYLHQRYKDTNVKTEESAVRIAEIFCVLTNLMQHPCYHMLRTTYNVVYDRSKPPAALRDIRWIFKDTRCGLSIVGRYEFFSNLTTMLREFVNNASSHHNTDITRHVANIFNEFVSNDRGESKLNEENFGTAIALAINVMESGMKNPRSQVA